MKSSKKYSRLKRATKFRAKNSKIGIERLCVYRSSRHIYAQIISGCGSRVLTSASTLSDKIKNSGNKEAAAKIGTKIAKNAKNAKITKVSFDRSGFKFHGRIKALADAARKGGLDF
jgi:large subunit ribosomal protein L18